MWDIYIYIIYIGHIGHRMYKRHVCPGLYKKVKREEEERRALNKGLSCNSTWHNEGTAGLKLNFAK